MRGMALVNAATLIAELGDLSRFADPRQLMVYLGLVPPERSSGTSIKRGGHTKGDPPARGLGGIYPPVASPGGPPGAPLSNCARRVPADRRRLSWIGISLTGDVACAGHRHVREGAEFQRTGRSINAPDRGSALLCQTSRNLNLIEAGNRG